MDFETDLATTLRLKRYLRDMTVLAEEGVETVGDLERVQSYGVTGVIVRNAIIARAVFGANHAHRQVGSGRGENPC